VLPELEEHYRLLRIWNQKLNLTSEDSLERHYGESIFLAEHLPPGSLRIVDIGSGAGFPGFPVAVVRPDCEVTLVESHQRKAVFLKEASRRHRNIRVLAKRAEEIGERFDWAISRAVSYQDLGKNLKRLAAHAALLTGVEPPPAELGFDWETPVALPASRQRFLRVSRGTGPSFT
jgi:16S rRNA (guanine(527)-N(7))-methyltransferase RsmG